MQQLKRIIDHALKGDSARYQLFHDLLEFALATLAINSKTTSEEWQKVKKCLQTARPPNSTEKEIIELRTCEYALDLESVIALLLETVLGKDPSTDDPPRPHLLRELWTRWVNISTRYSETAREVFMSKLFDKASSQENIVLAKREKLICLVKGWDPNRVKAPLQKILLDLLPYDGTAASDNIDKRRKTRVNFSVEEDEAILVGALRFGSAWEQIKEDNSCIRKELTKTELEVSHLELDV